MAKTRTSQLEAQKKYDADNTVMICLKFNKNTDSDILEKLSAVPAKQTYIKALIRKDLEEK